MARRPRSSTRQLPRWGIKHDVFDPADAVALKPLLNPRTRLIFAETISNPLLRVADLGSLADVAREAGIPLVVDNTFAPLICRPIEHGASLVVHSVTKMIGGHSDLTLGVVVGARRLVEPIQILASTLGPDRQPVRELAGPAGLATLSLRFDRACAVGTRAGRRFESHGRVARVLYPGLASHPDHLLASRSLEDGYGAMVTIDLGTGPVPSRSSEPAVDSVRPQPGRRADHAEPSRHDQPSRPGRRPTRPAGHHRRHGPALGGDGRPRRPVAGISRGPRPVEPVAGLLSANRLVGLTALDAVRPTLRSISGLTCPLSLGLRARGSGRRTPGCRARPGNPRRTTRC